MSKKLISIFTVFFTSLTLLSFEIIYIKIFSIKLWQNYSSMIISIALLGFGFSGTILYIIQLYNINLELLNRILLPLYLFLIIACIILSAIIPFNPYEVTWNPIHFLYLIIHFILLLLPFTAGALLICIQFINNELKISVIYFYNLSGSGSGTILSLILLNSFHPFFSNYIMIWIITISIFIILCLDHISLKNKLLLLLPIIIFIPFVYNFAVLKFNLFKYSQFKDISYYLNLPDAKVIHKKTGLLGQIEIIEADGLRNVKGLSNSFQGFIPEQKGIFIDGNLSSILAPADNTADIEFLKHTTMSLPYYLLKNNINRSLIIGAGGGEGLLRGILHKSDLIDALEINENVINLMKKELSQFSGNIYNRKNINIINKDTREYLSQNKNKYNLIELSLHDSFNSSTSGVFSLNESYLYTMECFNLLFNSLTDEGIFTITRWLKDPPRDNIKLFNMALKLLKNNKIKNFKGKIVFIRSDNTATICISKNDIDTQTARIFVNDNSFDFIYLSDLKDDEVNNNIVLEKPYYYIYCNKILNEDKDFIHSYPFSIKTPTDNSPYFYNFIKLKSLKTILKKGSKQIPFTEWGILTLFILLIIITIISFILIILPIILSKIKTKKINKKNIYYYLYFFLIGIAFFFIEIPLIQKFLLFLSNPVYSFSIIISTLLISSSLGSLYSSKIKNKKVFYIIIIISILFYLLIIDIILNKFISQSIGIKFIITVLITFITGFSLGMPFPFVLDIVKNRNINILALCWGINGYASVISSLLAAFIAILASFKLVFILAGLFYLVSFLIFLKLKTN